MKIAVYPGTFDPITYGHIDVISKSLKIFDRLIVATTDNTDKDYFFSIDDRIDIINNSLFKDLKFDKAWWASFVTLFLSQMYDIQYFDFRISISFWILLTGLACII